MSRDTVASVVIAEVMRWEGGVADVGDGKGITRFGQTPGWLHTFGLPTPLTPVDAAQNYRTWLVKTRLIAVCDVADILAQAVVDFAVHAGHRVAITELQAGLRVAMDGVIGPETEHAIDGCDRKRTAARVIAGRVMFNGKVIASDLSKAKFARGWANRIAPQIEALV